MCSRMPKRPAFSEEQLREAVAASWSYTETLRRLDMRPAGGNHRTLRKYVELWAISVDHFDPYRACRDVLRRMPRPLDEVLTIDSTYSRRVLKTRLYESGLKLRLCELCGQGEIWRGRRFALILDHIKGIATDNRLENLRIVCPNCAATLDTHCGKNVRLPRACELCGTTFKSERSQTRHCSLRCAARSEANRAANLGRRRVRRPSYERLLAEVNEVGYSVVGRRYGVSDNAVRKWLKQSERSAPARTVNPG